MAGNLVVVIGQKREPLWCALTTSVQVGKRKTKHPWLLTWLKYYTPN